MRRTAPMRDHRTAPGGPGSMAQTKP
jgi:hypothetical protein